MIRINLLGEKKDLSVVFALHFLIGGSVVLSFLLLCVFIHVSLVSDLNHAEEQKELLEGKAKQLREQTKHVAELETKKNILAQKLTTIANLKIKKQGPVRVLDNIATSIPEKSWLMKVSQKGDVLDFNGIALDNQTIAEFINKLSMSPYFTSVELVYSKEFVKDEVLLKEFQLSAKLADMLKKTAAKAAEENKEDKSSKKEKKKLIAKDNDN